MQVCTLEVRSSLILLKFGQKYKREKKQGSVEFVGRGVVEAITRKQKVKKITGVDAIEDQRPESVKVIRSRGGDRNGII